MIMILLFTICPPVVVDSSPMFLYGVALAVQVQHVLYPLLDSLLLACLLNNEVNSSVIPSTCVGGGFWVYTL